MLAVGMHANESSKSAEIGLVDRQSPNTIGSEPRLPAMDEVVEHAHLGVEPSAQTPASKA